MLKRLMIFLILLMVPTNAANVEVFLSPDNSYNAIQNFIADDLYIASYTFDNAHIMDILKMKKNVTILLEASPAGGLIGKEILCEMQKNNISIFLYTGKGYMHAKYIVKGNFILISSENLGSDGFPKYNYGNRGWGVIVEDEKIADEFLKIFNEDLKNSKPFVCNLTDYKINYDEKRGKVRFQTRLYDDQLVNAIFAPDAIDDVLSLINSANKSLQIEQFYIYKNWGDKSNLFLEAAINKARQGLDVKILLDSTWYNIDKSDKNSNYYTAEYVNEIARKENLKLEARLADLNEIEKIHNKGMIIDESTAFVSSINWNENSPKNNREAGLVITGDSARYFVDAFNYDWSGKKEDSSLLLLAIVLVVIIVIIIIIFKSQKK